MTQVLAGRDRLAGIGAQGTSPSMFTCKHVNIDGDKSLHLQRTLNTGTRAGQVSNAQ